MRLIFTLLLILGSAAPGYAQEGGEHAGTGADGDADTGADTRADTRADTDTDTETVTVTVTDTPALPPKIAIVIAGDPDAQLVEMASAVQDECSEAGLRTPADPALREAMMGVPATTEDGLDGVRSLRRSLGVDPRKDPASYKRLGSIAGADALVVLRRAGDIKLEVFDVSASQFYEGALDVEGTTSDQRVGYIRRRADVAQERWSEPVVVATSTSAGPADANLLAGEPVDEPEKKRWIKKAWPYLVVGALLVGGVTYIIVDQRRTNDPGPALLTFRPGEE